MSGFAIATGQCIGCRCLFSFNPVRVPSITVDGTREPLCKGCFERVNRERQARGLPAFPLAADAYEPVEESELYW